MIKTGKNNGQEINTETYLKNNKIKKENTVRIDIEIYLKKKKEKLKEYQKNYREAKKSQYNNESNSFLIVI